jgi:hypothetical protein
VGKGYTIHLLEMKMSDIRIARDDLIPLMESYGMAAIISDLAKQNASAAKAISVLEFEMSGVGIFIEGLSENRLEHLVADLKLAGKLPTEEVALGSNVEGVTRTAAPSGIGCAGGNVWVTPPGEGAVLRFYVNGEYKLTTTVIFENGVVAGGYISDLTTLGAVSGDIVQVGQVVDGVPGWWARIAVP